MLIFSLLTTKNAGKKHPFKDVKYKEKMDWFIAVPAKIIRSGHQNRIEDREHL